MIVEALMDAAASVVATIIGWFPTVALPGTGYDLAPLVPILQAPAALLPMAALVYVLALSVTLGIAQAVFAVVRFVRTVGAP